MAKALKTAITIVIAVFITYITFGAGAAVAWGAALQAGLMTFIVAGIGILTAKGMDAGAGNLGTKATIRAPAAPRQLVYGETVVGGVLAYVTTTGTDNNLLHMVIALAGHEIQSVEKVRLNGIELTTSSATVNSTTVYSATNSEFVNADNDNAIGGATLVRYTTNLGASDQDYNQFAAAQMGAWGNYHKLRGIAYIYIQCVFDNEKFGGGMPVITARVKGKKVYDPRLNSGSGGTAWSSNPALCVRDYLMDTTNGMGAPSTEINDTATTGGGGFVSAANICDQDVDDIDGDAEDRYTMNGFFNTHAEPAATIEAMLSSCAGKVTYSNGKFNMFAGSALTPTLIVTDDDLLAPVNVVTNQDTGNLFNGVRGIFVDKDNKYQSGDFPPYQSSTYLNADTPSGAATANYVKWMELQYPFTLSLSTSQRLARIALNNNRQSTSVSILTTLKFYQAQVGDWIKVTNDRMSWDEKFFEIMNISFEPITEDESTFLALRLVLKETATSVYAFDTDNDYVAKATAGTASNVSVNIPDVNAPSSLALTPSTLYAVNFHNILCVWVNSVSETVIQTEVQYKKTAEADNTYQLAGIVAKGQTRFTINGLEANTGYTVRIRHHGLFHKRSDYITATATTGGTALAATDLANASLTNAQALSAIGYTPYNASNPSNYAADQSLPTHTTSTSDPSGSAVVGSTHLKTGVTPQELWIYTSGTGWVHQVVNSDVDTVVTFTSGNGHPSGTVPPAGSQYIETGTTPDTLWISDGSAWQEQGLNTDTQYVLPTHTSGSGVPNNNTTPSPNPLNSTYLNTATDPDTLYISDGTDWQPMGVNSNTQYVLPTWTTGSGVPSDSTTPDPNPLGSSYLRTGVTPNTLYISNGSSWILQAVDSNTEYTFEDLLSADSIIAQWTTSDGAVYSPASLTQDLTVTYDGTTSSSTCTVRWTFVNVSSSNNDYISACAFQGTSTGFTLGSITDLSGNDVKYATCVVTHTASSETITLSALLSLLNVSGGGK